MPNSNEVAMPARARVAPGKRALCHLQVKVPKRRFSPRPKTASAIDGSEAIIAHLLPVRVPRDSFVHP